MEIKTNRLTIRRLTPDTAQAIHENSLDENTRRFVPDEVFETLAEARETVDYLISCYDSSEPNPLVYGIFLDKNCIGYVQAVPMDEGKWEIGYHIAEKHTRKGYATEAVKAFLPEIMQKLALTEILGVCLKENAASVKVMERCGFEKVFSGVGRYQGKEHPICRYIYKAP
ncbi:MAG: GNAT family N-acetyltransferase [Clostridia bacterium]|nr:GNAT family N-acetyltransferase [Clostridia bacterium]